MTVARMEVALRVRISRPTVMLPTYLESVCPRSNAQDRVLKMAIGMSAQGMTVVAAPGCGSATPLPDAIAIRGADGPVDSYAHQD
jgi:hypothetical protein